MNKVIAICGDSSSGKTTLSNRLENVLSSYNKSLLVLDCDRYHKWERSSDLLKKYTNLNPYSNHLDKLKSDIISLKDGEEVYQVDYDHKTGKFTDVKTIQPAEIIIVCGLHSIDATENISDFKVYLDTDEDLKKKWKIARDTIERGYSEQQVIESINKRKCDYELFILPQREKADLIIRYYLGEDNEILKSVKIY